VSSHRTVVANADIFTNTDVVVLDVSVMSYVSIIEYVVASNHTEKFGIKLRQIVCHFVLESNVADGTHKLILIGQICSDFL
jgi:hypothetical protein